MYRKAVETIKKYDMLKKWDTVVIGLSGGADSCALTMILAELRREYCLQLAAVHINHGIRGDEADADEEFSRKFCEWLGVGFLSFRFDVPAEAKKMGVGEEEAGRRIRYRTLRETAEKLGGGKIAVAHNLNDTAETLIMNLCRGSGLRGMTGISPVSGDIIRPLIECPREEIEKFCDENGIEYRTDSTNLQNDYTRNKIRNVIFPLLKNNINPAAVENMAKTASILRDEDAFMEKAAKKALDDCLKENSGGRAVLDAERLKGLDRALRRRALRLALGLLRPDMRNITERHTREMEDILFSPTGKAASLPGGIRAKSSYGLLIIEKERERSRGDFSYILETGVRTFIPEAGRFVMLSDKPEDIPCPPEKIIKKTVDADSLKGELVCRARKPGDTLSIKGGRKKLKDVLIDDKIPAEKRDEIPVIACGNNVVAVGDRLGFDYYVTGNTVRKAYIYIWEE